MQVRGYAARSAGGPLVPFDFERREVGPNDVQIQILYCGVCHSDLHMCRNEWGDTVYPVVPGHEIVGRVSQVGQGVGMLAVGDLVGVGSIVGSCGRCRSCGDGLEQYCEEDFAFVFNSTDRYSTNPVNYGGFSTHIVVDERYVIHIPKGFSREQLPGVAPLLCAGITTYSPLRHWEVGKGSRVGVIGLGGLGHLAVKLASALGAHVAVFTHSADKVADAKRLGAHEVILAHDSQALEREAGRFELLLDTSSSPHALEPYLELLERDGTLCLLGAPAQPHPPLGVSSLIDMRRQLAGSTIGGLRETQQLLDFCAKHQILADIELLPITQVNTAFERMLNNDVKYRFVVDMGPLI